MNELKDEELYFASVIDSIIAVDDLAKLAKVNKKLISLYRELFGYGISCQYEYAFTENGTNIPAISFDSFDNDGITEPGIPGIAVICRNSQLILVATSMFTGILDALEFENNSQEVLEEMKLAEIEDESCYFNEIFTTSSVKEMAIYLENLSFLIFQTGGYAIPLSENRVVMYWTRILANGEMSYDRISIYEISSKVCVDGDFFYKESYLLSANEETRFASILKRLKVLLENVRSEYCSNYDLQSMPS